MRYELRYRSGLVERWEHETPALSALQEEALFNGAQLVRIDDQDVETMLCDLDEATQVSPRAPGRSASAGFTSETPLLAVEIGTSESAAFGAGDRFATLTDFDAAVRRARAHRRSGPERVWFVIIWKDGSRFYGSFELFADTEEFLGDYVHRLCGEVLNDRTAASRARAEAALTVERMLHAAVAETLDRLRFRR